MAVVVFNYATWVLRYPEFASVANQVAQLYFDEAGLYCDNTECSPVCDPPRSTFLNMLTAHIASLNAIINGQPSSPLVGRISNASEGSVSVATENQYPPGSAQWFQQTKYGAAFWQASASMRTMRYVPNTGRTVDPYSPYAGFSGRTFPRRLR